MLTPLEREPGDDDVDLRTTGAEDPSRLLHRDPAQAERDDDHDDGGDRGFDNHDDGMVMMMEKQNMIKD